MKAWHGDHDCENTTAAIKQFVREYARQDECNDPTSEKAYSTGFLAAWLRDARARVIELESALDEERAKRFAPTV